ncbi:MAG: hypothetical protein ACN6OR_00975, partial [Stenotrophomonas sp.]
MRGYRDVATDAALAWAAGVTGIRVPGTWKVGRLSERSGADVVGGNIAEAPDSALDSCGTSADLTRPLHRCKLGYSAAQLR